MSMKPYYEDESVQIYHADCRDVLPTLEPSNIVVTDPPYNIGFGRYESYTDRLQDSEYTTLLTGLLRFESIAISDYPEEMMRFVVPALGPPLHVGAWCYHANQPRRFRLVNYYGHKPDYSRIKQSYRNLNDKRIQALLDGGSEGSNLYEWWDDIEIVMNVSIEKTGHPCPMPERLVARILTLFSEGTDTILDPFMGSGTTLRAAKDLGRKAIGIEIEERYCEIAAKRMAQLAMTLV